MRRLLPPHLEAWQPTSTDDYSRGEEHHLLDSGAVLLLDAEGSTELSARLRAQGTLGAEPLVILLDQIFAASFDAVIAAGGCIGHFTGDGVIALFLGDPTVAVGNAVSAAGTILEHLHQLSGVVTPAGPVDLAVRAVIGAGTINTFLWRAPTVVDEQLQNAVYVIVGTALAEAQHGELLVGGGALALGPTAASALPVGHYLPLADGYVGLDPSQITPDRTRPVSQSSPPVPEMNSRRENGWRFVIPAAFDDAVQPEFRDAIVLFLELRRWPHEDTVAVIIEQAAVTGGHVSNVLRTSADQQGLTFMLVWGAPTGHVADASRSLRFIEAVQHEIGLGEFKTGAVHANMFTGFVGSAAQSTYTLVGAPVNLASRLCSLADWGEIRVTDEFDDVIPSHWAVNSVETTLYRGFSTPLVTLSLRPPDHTAQRVDFSRDTGKT